MGSLNAFSFNWNNSANDPLVVPQKAVLPSLHIRLGMKVFVKVMNRNRDNFGIYIRDFHTLPLQISKKGSSLVLRYGSLCMGWEDSMGRMQIFCWQLSRQPQNTKLQAGGWNNASKFMPFGSLKEKLCMRARIGQVGKGYEYVTYTCIFSMLIA